MPRLLNVRPRGSRRLLLGLIPILALLLLYFAVAGLLWAWPISYIIRWMARPDKKDAS